jgi:hypothetical protein
MHAYILVSEILQMHACHIPETSTALGQSFDLHRCAVQMPHTLLNKLLPHRLSEHIHPCMYTFANGWVRVGVHCKKQCIRKTTSSCVRRDKRPPNLTNVSMLGLESAQNALARGNEPGQKKTDRASDPLVKSLSVGVGQTRLLAFCAFLCRLVTRFVPARAQGCEHDLSRSKPEQFLNPNEVDSPPPLATQR